jgi:hypothetical protein
MNLTYRGTCRLCGSAALTPAIDLGPQYLQGAFVKPDRPPPPLDRIPTELVRCDRSRDPGACGLLQTRVTVPGELLYREYWYRSSTNRTMRDHLRGIAEQAVAHVGADIRALDIGCNDGTLLKSYPASVTRVGVDPSDAARGVEGDLVVINDFFPSPALRPELVRHHLPRAHRVLQPGGGRDAAGASRPEGRRRELQRHQRRLDPLHGGSRRLHAA